MSAKRSGRRTGWRAWDLGRDKNGPVLKSPEVGRMFHRLTYPQREAYAECFEYEHTPPHVDCWCGMYTAESVEAARVWLPPNSTAVVGQVELLGRVVQGTADAVNITMHEFLPVIGDAIGRQTSAEFRSTGVRLVGTQMLHPGHAASIPALEARYGVPFSVEPSLGVTLDVVDELAAKGKRFLAMAASLTDGPDAAGLMLFNEARTHVVLQLRSPYVDHPNTWAFPGGAVEPGETPTDAALREAWEEARIAPARVRVEQEVALRRKKGRPGYTYVVGTTHWTPDMDRVLPLSTNLEAQGAAWLPVAVLDTPDRYPKVPLHPLLAKAWPQVRARIGDLACSL
ncbi:MAG TPA: NUDIX domain-containing protein [Nocardioidaceae bacterium]|nr:NUDIX domain-containing protein [Nocardioidaceae bacterium]